MFHKSSPSVTEFRFESPETSQGIMQLDIESKVEPTASDELKNDYIEYAGATEEDDYIDYTRLWSFERLTIARRAYDVHSRAADE